jgi:ectoine hydroxylase-related dioxygenase (phytanoyl-CoA dioxygenase family)
MTLSLPQIERFNEEGFLIVEGALEEGDLAPVIDEYSAHIDARARQLHAEGKISRLYEEESFERRLARICRENNEIYGDLDIMKLRGRASFEFLRNERLLDLVEGIVGPEITCSPIQHIRPKLPDGLTPGGHDHHVVPWHQDAGVTWAEADAYFILTVWIPMSEATPENGCLEIIPRVHGKGLMRHLREGGTHIAPEEMPEGGVVQLPVRKGDVIFIHKEIPHRSLPNRTDKVRWSIDLRYQKTGTPTGRPFHPDFVARSRANPGSALTDYETWRDRWVEALEKSRGIAAHRWK